MPEAFAQNSAIARFEGAGFRGKREVATALCGRALRARTGFLSASVAVLMVANWQTVRRGFRLARLNSRGLHGLGVIFPHSCEFVQFVAKNPVLGQVLNRSITALLKNTILP